MNDLGPDRHQKHMRSALHQVCLGHYVHCPYGVVQSQRVCCLQADLALQRQEVPIGCV